MKTAIQDILEGDATERVERIFDRYGVEFLMLCINHKFGSGYAHLLH